MDAYLDDLTGRGAIPRNCESLLFDEPWQGRAFGMALALAEAKSYRWEDFRQSLIRTIGDWDKSHMADDPTWNYYQQWLAAFEQLALDKGLIDPRELDQRTEEFLHRTRDEVI
ncbi:nitrile hydratase accessory protein [Methylobacterium sp. 190mf]|uniref:nitrile hydratase accessory protein n=1 Tax=Methylobacterium sp. 190mf TaxID=1761798 RepID=UPI00089F1103|nr:nitrile hydratase accessory protein [Methylobacterium sp. 190mf]SEG66760.1 nitrile hydratase accessory protein [Methylobacterium sp. 190mf]